MDRENKNIAESLGRVGQLPKFNITQEEADILIKQYKMKKLFKKYKR